MLRFLRIHPPTEGIKCQKRTTSGDWSVGSNWTGGVAPGVGDDAVIDASGSYVVTISTAITANPLTISSSGATVTETASGSLSLAGALTLSAGTLQLNSGTTTVGAQTQSGGELAGTGTLTVSGTTALSGGGMEGGSASVEQGNLVAQGALTISLGSSGFLGTALDGGWTLTAEGTTNWTGGYIYFGYNPSGTTIGGTNTWVNAAGATFDDQNTANYNIVQDTDTGVFDNAGLFDKTAASGASTTTIETAFNNSGTLEVDAGIVDLTGATANSGILEAQGGTLDVANALSGGGQLSIGTGGEIEPGIATNETATFTGTSGSFGSTDPPRLPTSGPSQASLRAKFSNSETRWQPPRRRPSMLRITRP
jgi:hypothetical protein